MTKKKTEAPAAPETDVVATLSLDERLAEREKRIEELEAKIRAGEEAALSRVCKAMGVDPDNIKRSEEHKAKNPEGLVSMFVHYPVNINGTLYKGQVTVPYGTFRVISQALGDRRMRILRELTGSNFILQELNGGGWAPKLVGQVDAAGDRIA